MDTGQTVIPFPSRWDSGLPKGMDALFRWYPYQLAYCSTLLKRELPDAKVTLIDGNIEGLNGDQYIQRIAKLHPDVLICELSALTYPTMTRVMGGVKHQLNKTVSAILCGPMAKTHFGDLRRDYEWDFLVQGEYELKVLELLGGTIPAAAYTDAGLINLDWLPWPEDEDTNRIDYFEINHYAKSGIIQLYPTRGCPLSCTFCVVPSYYGGHGKTARSHRCRDVEDVCDEITYLAYRYGDRFHGCYFNEEAHNANVEWLASFCEALIRRGLNKYQYDAMTGAWTYTRELVELMSRAGYRQIRFGVESTSEQVGRSIKKTVHKHVIDNLLGWCKEFGVGAYITLQVGAMGSTEQSDLATIADAKEWIRKGLVQKWQLSTSCPQPGTPFHALAKKSGWLLTDDISRYDGYHAIVDYPEYPAHHIQRVRDTCGL